MGKDKDDCALGAHTVTKWKKRGNGKVAMMSVGAIPVPLYSAIRTRNIRYQLR
ncbi:MAG: hypothetical protein R3D26_12435 [Cyanobacteriota/Melainabacteria group bacterium]